MLISVFLGCETADDVGLQYKIDSGVGVKFVEINLPASNVFIDSLRTDGRNLIVGNYTDQLTGQIEAEGYFRFSYVSGTLPSDTLDFERMELSLQIEDKILTSLDQSFSIFMVEDTISSDLVYLSSNKQELGVDPVAEANMMLTSEQDSITIEMDEIFAEAIFDSLKSNSSYSTTSFIYPTLAIVSNTVGNIFEFDMDADKSYLKIFMKGAAVDETYEVVFSISRAQYSFISRDRSSTDYEGIVEDMDFQIPSEKTIIDPVAGLSTSIDISEYFDFVQENKNAIVNSAIISFEFDSDIDRDTLENYMLYFRKSDLSFFGPALEVSQFNHITASNEAYFQPFLNGRRNFTPAISVLSSDKSIVHVDVTYFARNLYSTSLSSASLKFQNPFVEEPRSITDLVLISFFDTSLGRTVFKRDGIKLKIHYTFLEE